MIEASHWDERYRSHAGMWGEPNRFLVEYAEPLPPGTALDLACGEGRNGLWLAERGWDVLGVDFSQVAIERAAAAARDRGLSARFEVADIEAWQPGDRRFYLVIVMYLHLPWDRMRGPLETAARSVAPGGRLLVVGHHLDNLTAGVGGPPSPEVLYTEDMIAGVIAPPLTVRVAERRERPAQNGVAIDAVVLAEAQPNR